MDGVYNDRLEQGELEGFPGEFCCHTRVLNQGCHPYAVGSSCLDKKTVSQLEDPTS